MDKELKTPKLKPPQFFEIEARLTQLNIVMDGVNLKLSKINLSADQVRNLLETQQCNEPIRFRIQLIQTALFGEGV